jgi:hypothetical protein
VVQALDVGAGRHSAGRETPRRGRKGLGRGP